MANDKTHFRTSVSGFNKADVLEYLDKLNADFREESVRTAAALEEKNKRIEALTAEAEQLRAELEEQKAMYEGAVEIAAGIKQELVDAQEELEKTKTELEKAGQALAESEAVIASQTELIDGLGKQDKTEDEAGETEEKADPYDGMSSQIGDILIAANKSAEEIIAGANERARRIDEETAAAAQSSRNAFAAAMEECTRTFAEKAGAVSGTCCEDINAELQRTREAVDRVLLQMQKSALCIAEKTQQAKESLDTELRSSLDTLDSKIAGIKKNDN